MATFFDSLKPPVFQAAFAFQAGIQTAMANAYSHIPANDAVEVRHGADQYF